MKIRKIISLICAAAMLLSVSACKTEEDVSVHEVIRDFDVSVLKAGQADAIILKTQNHCAIIDCGEEDDGDEVLEHLSENGIEKVDYLFITHFDKDHVGGAAEVLENVFVDNIITPDYEGTNGEYKKFIQAVNEKNYTPIKLTTEMSFALDDVEFNVYPPLKSAYKEGDNDFSLAISAVHGENSFLFAGDAQEVRLSEILAQTNTEYDFLKVPHHGRIEKNSNTFFDRINPKYAVITCSDKNPADEKVLGLLSAIWCKTYLTSDGDVNIKSDGKEITVSQ